MIGVAAGSDLEFEPLDYRTLLGAAAWRKLPPSTRARFARHSGTFVGTMVLNASRWGRWVERLCRLIGSPLPPASSTALPASVRVEHDPATGGSRWIRCYDFPHGPVEIRSVKALDCNGRLVERLAIRFADAARRVRARRRPALREHRLFLRVGGFAAKRLPAWSLPGCTHVVHRDLGDGRFLFTMTVRHVWLGELFNHAGTFRTAEVRPCQALIALLSIQIVLGLADNLWHHELTERLPAKRSARVELAMHALRELGYGFVFIAIAWWRWHGAWSFVLAAVVIFEVLATIADFVIEDRTRRLPPLERVAAHRARAELRCSASVVGTRAARLAAPHRRRSCP